MYIGWEGPPDIALQRATVNGSPLHISTGDAAAFIIGNGFNNVCLFTV